LGALFKEATTKNFGFYKQVLDFIALPKFMPQIWTSKSLVSYPTTLSDDFV
jgi:hypothetical protein